MENMNVSIIVPTYKRTEKMLDRALQSIFNQTYKNYEVIIIDDNNKGNKFYNETIKCELKYKNENNIKFIYHEVNRGANTARNSGIKNSNYDILAFLDSDDEWENDYLELMIQKLKEDNIGLCYSGYYIISERSIKRANCNGIEGNIFNKEIIFDRISPTSCVMIKKKFVKKAGMFDETLPARQDFDMWVRMSRECLVATVKKPLVKVYRNGHESISSDYHKRIKGTNMVYDKILKSLSEGEKEKYRKKIDFGRNKNLSEIYLQCRIYDKAKIHFKESIKNGLDLKLIVKMFLFKLGLKK